MTGPEASRAGLRKAPDADLHPSTPVDGAAEGSADPGWRTGRASTSDSVGMPDKDKLVTWEVTVPKSLRKAVRQEAKRRGISADDVVVEALRDRPSR